MIARLWRGLTPAHLAEDYLRYLHATGLKDYAATDGNRGMLVLGNVGAEQAEFALISFWESMDAIRRFAGDDVEKAVYYPEDEKYLLTFEPKVAHYEVANLTGLKDL
jgi:heme-degrading monooxygenase HmoA